MMDTQEMRSSPFSASALVVPQPPAVPGPPQEELAGLPSIGPTAEGEMRPIAHGPLNSTALWPRPRGSSSPGTRTSFSILSHHRAEVCCRGPRLRTVSTSQAHGQELFSGVLNSHDSPQLV